MEPKATEFQVEDAPGSAERAAPTLHESLQEIGKQHPALEAFLREMHVFFQRFVNKG